MPTKDPERKKIQRRNYYYRKSKIINKKKINQLNKRTLYNNFNNFTKYLKNFVQHEDENEVKEILYQYLSHNRFGNEIKQRIINETNEKQQEQVNQLKYNFKDSLQKIKNNKIKKSFYKKLSNNINADFFKKMFNIEAIQKQS